MEMPGNSGDRAHGVSYGSQMQNVGAYSQFDYRFNPDAQKYCCPFCHRQYTAKRNVLAHVNEKHKGQFPYICEVCGKGFRNRRIRDGHMASHGAPKQFECSICGQRYAHKSSLIAHQKVTHY